MIYISFGNANNKILIPTHAATNTKARFWEQGGEEGHNPPTYKLN